MAVQVILSRRFFLSQSLWAVAFSRLLNLC